MRISDWSSDVCSSDLEAEGDAVHAHLQPPPFLGKRLGHAGDGGLGRRIIDLPRIAVRARHRRNVDDLADYLASFGRLLFRHRAPMLGGGAQDAERRGYVARSVERRVVKGCGGKSIYRGVRYHSKIKTKKNNKHI